MPIKIEIHPGAFDAGNALEAFATRAAAPWANTRSARLATGEIASASPLTARSNILPDGTFPAAPATTEGQENQVVVHVSPTSGSAVIRSGPFIASHAEFDPAYGLDITTNPVEIQEDMFETVINEPVGAQFKAKLQDLVERFVIKISDASGVTLDAGDIAAYTAP